MMEDEKKQEEKYDLDVDAFFTKKVLPVVMHHLLVRGLIDKNNLQNHTEVKRLIKENPHIVENIGVSLTIHGDFVASARDAVALGRNQVAIVLLATAIEQTINVFYRNALSENELLTRDEITEIIKTASLTSKLGWLLTMTAGYEFNDDFRKRIVNLIEVRNQIVHYKAVPSEGMDDDLGGSYNVIQSRINNVDFDDLLSLSFELDDFLNDILDELREKVDPNYKLIQDAVALRLSESEKSK